MNYISQLNRFFAALTMNPLTPKSICLYSILLNINNKTSWSKEFTCGNITIQAVSGLSRVDLDRSRNELVQKGYIGYKKGAGNQAGKYLIVQFDTQTDIQSVTQSDTEIDTQSEHKLIHKVSTLNKLKTKTIPPPIYPPPITEEQKSSRFVVPTLSEVKAYCAERGNKLDPQTFVDFYESKGWKIGKDAMKDWKACIRTWEKRDVERFTARAKPQNYPQREYSIEELNSYFANED